MLRFLCFVGALAHGSTALLARPAAALRVPTAFSVPVPENIYEDDDPEKPRLITGDEADAFVAMLDGSAATGGAELVAEPTEAAPAEAAPAEAAPKKRWVKPSER